MTRNGPAMLLRLFLSLLIAFGPSQVWAANRFWVGGTGTSTSTAVWSTSSGGSGGASVPGSGDAAIIDALSGGGTYTIAGSATYGSLSFTNVNKTDVLSFASDLTIAALGTVSITGASVTNRAYVTSNALNATPRTINVPLGALVTVTNVDFQDIVAAGLFGTWSGTSVGDAGGNSGITFDASVAQTLASTGTINWSTATWTTRIPLPQDDVTLPSLGSATTITADMPRMGRSIDMTNFNRSVSFASTPNSFFGSWTFGAGGTYTGTMDLTAFGRGNFTITSNGKQFPQGIFITASGGTYTLADTFSSAGNLQLPVGTFNVVGKTISAVNYFSAAANTRALQAANSIWNISRTNSTPWNVSSTNNTVDFTGAVINLTGTNSTTLTFNGGDLTYGTLNWSNVSSTGTLIITGNNTWADIQNSSATARTIQFAAGTTQNLSAFSAGGSSGHILSITSSSAGSQATLRRTTGRVSTDYLSLKDSAATGGATFFAGAHSSVVSNVSGWILAGPNQAMRIGARWQ